MNNTRSPRNHQPQEDEHIRETRERENHTSEIQKLIKKIKMTLAWLWLATAGLVASIPEAPVKCQNQDESHETCKKTLWEGELFNNYINSYARAYNELWAWDFVVLDDHNNIINNEVHTYATGKDKQKQRDALRKQYHDEFGTSTNEKNTPVIAIIPQNQTNSTATEIIKKNSETLVIWDDQERNRLEYIRDEFEDVTGNKIVDAFLSENIIGLVGNESQYDNDRKSSVNAIGIFQLMPKTIKHKTFNPDNYDINDVKVSLKLQTEIAKNHFKEDFKILNRYTEQIANQYFDWNQEKALKYVIAPFVLNSYNTWATNVAAILTNFPKKFPNQQSIQKHFKYEYSWDMGADIFYFMTLYGKNEMKNTYGDESQKYTFKAIAVTRAINESYEKPSSYETPYKQPNILAKKWAWIRWKFSNWIQETDNKNTQKSERIPVEEFYKAGKILEKGKDLKGKILSANIEKVDLPTKIQSSVINPWIEDFKDELEISPAKNKNEITWKSLKVFWDKYSYRLNGVGQNDDGKKLDFKNDEDYMKMHPKAIDDLEEICERFEKFLQKNANLPKNLAPTIIVTSIARDHDYAHKHIPNASKNSAHFYGIAFDFSKNFEIRDKETWAKQEISKDDQEIMELALRRVLDDMRQEGIIFVIIEGKPAHYHIQSRVWSDPEWTPPVSKTS